MVEAVRNDWRAASLNARLTGMLAFAEKLTKTPAACTDDDIAQLRRVGLEDEEILALVMLVGFFNLATRVADALGVELDPQLTRGTEEYEAFFAQRK